VVPEVNTNTAIIQTVLTVLHLSHILLHRTLRPLQMLSSASFYFATPFNTSTSSNSCTSMLLTLRAYLVDR